MPSCQNLGPIKILKRFSTLVLSVTRKSLGSPPCIEVLSDPLLGPESPEQVTLLFIGHSPNRTCYLLTFIGILIRLFYVLLRGKRLPQHAAKVGMCSRLLSFYFEFDIATKLLIISEMLYFLLYYFSLYHF